VSSRQRISEKLLLDLAKVWETHGESVPERLAITEPGKLASIAYGLLPRDIFVSVQQRTPAGMDADDWSRMLSLARTMSEIAPDASLDDIVCSHRKTGLTTTVASLSRHHTAGFSWTRSATS